MFGRATITLGIGPHCSIFYFARIFYCKMNIKYLCDIEVSECNSKPNLNSCVRCKTDCAKHRVRSRQLHSPIRHIVVVGQCNFDGAPYIRYHRIAYTLTMMTIATNLRQLKFGHKKYIYTFPS